MRLSNKAKNITPSPTLALDAKTKELQASGVDIVSFGVGEPDFDTPLHIQVAGIDAIRGGHTRYTAGSGTLELRNAVVAKYKNECNVEYTPAQVIVSSGAKHSLYNAFLAICDDGDEVIIPAPYWVSYPDMVKLAGGVPVIMDTTGTGFKVTPAALERHITPKTKAIILNSPSNPSGAVYSEKELRAIADVIVKNDIILVSDDIYEALIYDGTKYICVASFGKEVYDRTIVINGVSKSYAMTGWRIGYACGPKDVIKAMGDIQSHTTSCPSSVSQKASVAALRGDHAPVRAMVEQFKKRCDYMSERLAAMPGIECPKPLGAFYCFPKVSSYYGKSVDGVKIMNSIDFSGVMLEKAHIALVAGSAFGSDDYVRLSYATSMEKIKEGLDRMERLLLQIK